ncbi:carbonate dehydratase [Dyadobacter tibetensis]|uniref:carbonate dehydratase n=1 Tax=Dyadobacter tibetensis TaxID=1211851 RepID=UPI00047007D9|nr:carbonate dehydratase [Dyadobacter tibetensis]
MDRSYNKLFENNVKWVAETTAANKDFFTDLANGQKPEFLWIGCSDSRVPANQITGTNPGEIFVHRNIANMVVHTDMNLLSVIDYSVNVLGVKHIMVVGHYGCGGVKAAMGNAQVGLIDNWLRHIKDVYRLHEKELDSIIDEDLRADRLVELNVIEQVYNLGKTSIVQNAWSNNKPLQLHGIVYDIKNGLMKDLKVSADDNSHIRSVYRLNPTSRNAS